MPDPVWAELVRNAVRNPALRAGTANVGSDGTLAVATVSGKQWVSTTGTYLQFYGDGLPNQFYAASVLLSGTPGAVYSLDTSDYTVGAYCTPVGGTIPAGGSVRVQMYSSVPTAAGCTMVVVTLYTPAVKITEALIQPVAGPGQTTVDYFDGDTVDTLTERYDWVGPANASPSTLSTLAEVPPEPEPEPEWPGSMGPYPLPDDRHYFSIDATSPFIHTGFDPADQSAIMAIQTKVGTDPDGYYGPGTASAVVAWRLRHGAEPEEYVDDELWWLMDTSLPEPEG